MIFEGIFFLFAPPGVGGNVPTPFLQFLLLLVLLSIPVIYSFKKGYSVVAGGIEVAIAVLGLVWANGHSPYSYGLGVTWVLKEPAFYIILLFFVGYGIHGVVNIVKALNNK